MMPTAAPLRLGLLGCGSVAYWFHLRTLRRLPGAVLVAAADPDAEARRRAGRLTRVPIHEHAEQLLSRPDVEAVIIAAPTPAHAALAVSAAEGGKHFYLEKPIATSTAEAARVIEAAERARVIGAIGFNRRSHPLYQQARSLLAAGRIGRVCAVQTAFCEPVAAEAMPAWKRRRATGGGVLLDLASHHIDQLRWLLGEEIVSVAATLGSKLTEHDTARLALGLSGGAQAQGFFSFRGGPADYLHFVGEQGTLLLDRHAAVLELRAHRRLGYGTARRWITPTPAVAAWRLRRLIRPSADPSYRLALAAFVELVRGSASPAASLDDGVRSLETVLAAEDVAGRADAAPIGTGGPCASC